MKDAIVEQNIIGIILAAISLIVAYIFYRRSLIRAQLAFIADSIQITGRDSKFTPDLKILYRNKEVERVTKSTFIIWNSGNTTIYRNQIVDADPLRLQVSNGSEILDAYITKTTRDVNAFSIQVHNEHHNEIVCVFDFLDSRDGVVIEVLHTGNGEVDVQGTIRGIPAGVKPQGRIPDSSNDITTMNIIGATVTGIVLTGGGIFIAWGGWAWHSSWFEWLLYIGLILALLGALSFILSIIGLLWRFFKWITRKSQPPSFLLKSGEKTIEVR